ncbi:hypothetical protein ACTI_50320 [Actinoplanes sp. OR16]|uniref:FxSxx-COOH system tetratricopeptide repeat protein n=1 Tax=Actinoplanes sp. OR16 TaxID=946334 RepID=UPI000F6CD2FC|nr:FxSxx-COOH system tetratricopeptide repeat protein [Actinoplanes sp. OR16]BBH68347.1 hypothetical protein ACTI_50320 [Actinoplanes sp. OR16]
MDRSRLAALIEASRQAHLDLSADEWREILFLAAVLQATGAEQGAPEQREAATDMTDPLSPPQDSEPLQAPAPGATWQNSPAGGPPLTAPDVPVVPYSSSVDGSPHGVPMRAPAVQPLARSAFARAMRPVKQRVPDTTTVEVDIPATVRQAAEGGAWLPVLKPAVDRWLDIALVVDDAASGPAWVQEIRSFTQAIEESGAFGDVRVWRFDSEAPQSRPLTVSAGTIAAHVGRPAGELIDPSGRRAILVLSDCVGPGWADGRVGAMISTWTPTNTVGIVHLLPQRLWGRCAARFLAVDWKNGPAYVARQTRRWRSGNRDPLLGEPEEVAEPRTLVPVLDLSPSALRGWATLISGGGDEWSKGVAFDPAVSGAYEPDEEDSPLDATVDEDVARWRVKRFRAVASPDSFRLATSLSAVPLLLPVVRLVQRSLLTSAQPTYWAEILLSGLVVRRPKRDHSDELEFDFQPGIRDELLTGLTSRDRLALLAEVSEFISAQLGGSFDFLALMMLDSTPEKLSEVDQPFARVAMQVLKSLGGAYTDKAAAIERSLPNSDREDGADAPTTRNDPLVRDGVPHVTATDMTDYPSLTDFRVSPADQVWDVPQRTQNFTGRRQLLDQLRQDLIENPNRAAVLVPRTLYGLGGVGKTALANEYAHRYRNDYEVVWWIPAEDPADVRRSLVELSRRLRLPESTDQSETIRTLLNELHEGRPKSRWLLIYDNATQPDKILDLLPVPKRHGHVLITSRDESWGARGGRLLEVDVFTRAESVTLLRRRAQRLTNEDADSLAALLQDLPLALHQAAAWHAETGLGADEYRRRYDEKLALLGEVELPPEYPRPVGAAFGVSYDQLYARSIAAAQLLQLCSHFGPEPIFVEMLYNARNVPGLPAALHRQIADRSTIGRELREIARYELIKFDQARGRFQLHRLVQSVLRRTLHDDQRQTTSQHAHSILALANPGNPDELSNIERSRHGQLSPHIQPSGIVGSTDLEARRVVLDQIRYRYVVGDFAGSRDLAESTVQRWLAQWGERDELVLLARRHLATTLRSLGERSSALEIDEEVMRLIRETIGDESDHYFVTANGYAADLRALGRFQEAHDFDKDLLALIRRVLREDDPATLRTANNFAVDLRLLGEFGKARELDIETVRLWTEGYGSDFPETLFAVSNLVRDYYGLGLYGAGLTMQQEVITEHEVAVGSSHMSVLMARRTIAMLLRKLGRYTEAREQADTNYTAYAAQFPEHHEHTLAAAMSLGNALRDESSRDPVVLNRARDLVSNALRIYQRDFAGHPFVEVCRTNLAIILRRLGEVAEARALNITARDALKDSLGLTHPYTICATTNLASDYAAMGDYEEALKFSAETTEISRQETNRGPNHPYTLACILNHALDLQGAGRGQHEAESLRRSAVDGFLRTLGPDHPDTQAARNGRRIDADIEPPPT